MLRRTGVRLAHAQRELANSASDDCPTRRVDVKAAEERIAKPNDERLGAPLS